MRHYQISQPGRHVEITHVRTGPLTTTQHILHLLLTIFTGGLWAPVWIICAVRGNRRATWKTELPPAHPDEAELRFH